MKEKQVPIWAFAVSILGALGLAVLFLLRLNPMPDAEAIARARTKPSSSPVAAQINGMPRGTPNVHSDPNQMVDARRKPGS